jgi:hypothetical protein
MASLADYFSSKSKKLSIFKINVCRAFPNLISSFKIKHDMLNELFKQFKIFDLN